MNSFSLYNSLTRKKVEFKPIKEGQIKLYVCGITVYDHCHIGHARSTIVYDYIVRFLRSQGWTVTYTKNITDVDDKIINRANENNESIHTLTERFITYMHEDFNKLGCLKPDIEPKATEYIEYMQLIINTLIKKDHAYIANNNDVYFSVDSFSNYGKLSHRKVEDMQSNGENIEGVIKKNPFDFVLWKSVKPNEPSWQSPWGNGRPGWHIECSAMAYANLGETIDIHGGGSDLMFPHHENEIAQSECAFDKTFANHWMHVGVINVNDKKMSKSLGNYVTIKDVLDKYHPDVIRYFMLANHYRSPINYSEKSLDEYQTVLSKIYELIKKHNQDFNYDSYDDEYNFLIKNSPYVYQFNLYMANDFNTPHALTVILDVIKEIQKSNDAYILSYLFDILKHISEILGILQSDPDEFLNYRFKQLIDEKQIYQAIESRHLARINKDYVTADEIRNGLLELGVVLEDKGSKTVWHYKRK